jgi:hypothetical protein
LTSMMVVVAKVVAKVRVVVVLRVGKKGVI